MQAVILLNLPVFASLSSRFKVAICLLIAVMFSRRLALRRCGFGGISRLFLRVSIVNWSSLVINFPKYLRTPQEIQLSTSLARLRQPDKHLTDTSLLNKAGQREPTRKSVTGKG